MALFNLLNCVFIVIPAKHIKDIFQLLLLEEKPYEVTGISPQSNTVAQLLKGFASRGTL